MSSALYRKYRPQTFSQMIGQNHIKITLQHELERGEIGHAYLFCGPRGLGKTTSARLFAKSVNCENRKDNESEPCNQCQSCQDIMSGRSVDMIEIDAASNTGVDNVRENIIENSRFNPVRSKFKVYIIDEVHMLSTSAFNALLKIMEEPPSHVIFILCTTEIHKLPLTIISRCQRFDFKKVTGEQLLKRLQLVVDGEEKKIEEEVLKRIIANSEGCVRDAESLLAKVLSLGDDITADQAEIVLPRSDFESCKKFIYYLSEKNSAAAIELINLLVDDGVDLVIFVDSLLEFLRRMLLVKANSRLENFGIELSDNLSSELIELTTKFNWGEIVSIIEEMSGKSKEIKQASIPQLPLEIAVIKIVENVSTHKPEAISFAASLAQRPVARPGAISQPVIKPVIMEETVKKTDEIKAEEISVVKEEAPITDVEYSGTAGLSDVIAKWSSVIQKLMKSNFSLGQVLRISQPIRFDRGILEIAVTSAFYKGRLESPTNRPIIETALESDIGSKVIIKGVVSGQVVPLDVAIEYEEESPVADLPAVSVVRLDPAEEVMGMF